MGLTEDAKARLRRRWAELARLAVAGEVTEAFVKLAQDAPSWLSPLEKEPDAYVLFGFARLAKAFARSKVTDLARRRPLLSLVAIEALHLLGEDAEASPTAQLPFRRDIDG